jgi:GntR family transcriptional regulator, transcriptional repressor for pyruvate dehydrogenase complex
MSSKTHTTDARVATLTDRGQGSEIRGRAKPRKTAVLLAQRIVDEIVDGGLVPGSMMLPEREMLAEYGVARGTLREALRFLEMHGIVEIKTGPGGGPAVSSPGSRPLASVIGLLLQVDNTPYRSIIDARLALEPMLAGRAAERRDDDDLAALDRSIEAMRDTDGQADFLEQNIAFHATIARAAGNRVLFHMASSLAWIEDGTAVGISYAREVHKPIIAAHRRIYAAIEAQDSQMAEAAMRLHVGEFAAYAEHNYPRLLGAPLRWEQVDA